jgi:hypothetical protein
VVTSDVAITLTVNGRTMTWVLAADGGWDAYDARGAERLEYDALTHNGVFTHLAGLLTHPEDIK